MKKLQSIKQQVSQLLGKEVTIFTREQRGRIDEHNGTIDKVFGSFFNLATSGSNKQQVSFTFADILTSEISIHATGEGIIIENRPAVIEREPVTEELEEAVMEQDQELVGA